MCLEDWCSYPNDSQRSPKLFWLGSVLNPLVLGIHRGGNSNIFEFSPQSLGKGSHLTSRFWTKWVGEEPPTSDFASKRLPSEPPRNASISNPFERCSLRWWFFELPLTSGICEFIPLRVAFSIWMGPYPNRPLSCDRAMRYSGLGLRGPWVLLGGFASKKLGEFRFL